MLENKVIAISGGASGIGLATALLAAKSGASGVVILDRDARALNSAVSSIKATGCQVEGIEADITADATPAEMVRVTVERFGRLDAGVNAAAIEGGAAELVELTDENFDRVMSVNLRAIFRCVREQLRQMYAQGFGSIVNISSASVLGVHPTLGAYVTSKAAVRTLSQVAAKEAGKHGVRVNAVLPGLTNTPMLAASYEDGPLTDDIAGRIPLGRIGQPLELANAIVWLCSDLSSFATASSLVVDGGRVG